jgi:hypothetical protein
MLRSFDLTLRMIRRGCICRLIVRITDKSRLSHNSEGDDNELVGARGWSLWNLAICFTS